MAMFNATPTQFHRTPTKKRVARGPCGGDEFSSPELLIGDGVSGNSLEFSAPGRTCLMLAYRSMDERQRVLASLIRTASNKDVTPQVDESLFDSGLLDSFALPSAIERQFHVSIPDSDLSPRKFESIAQIERYLDSRR